MFGLSNKLNNKKNTSVVFMAPFTDVVKQKKTNVCIVTLTFRLLENNLQINANETNQWTWYLLQANQNKLTNNVGNFVIVS